MNKEGWLYRSTDSCILVNYYRSIVIMKVRKFIKEEGVAAVECVVDADRAYPSINFSFSIGDGDDTAYFGAYIYDAENDKREYEEVVKMLTLLRDTAEEALDEMTSHWLTLKEYENENPPKRRVEGDTQEWEEDSAEGSDRTVSSRTTSPVQNGT